MYLLIYAQIGIKSSAAMESRTDVEPTTNSLMLNKSASQFPQSHHETAILEYATFQVPQNFEVYGFKQSDVTVNTPMTVTTNFAQDVGASLFDLTIHPTLL